MAVRTAARRSVRRAGVTTLATLALAAASPGGAVAAGPDHTFTHAFTVPGSANQQGLAYADGVHYVAFDMGGGGRIVAFDERGEELSRTPLLPLGHAVEVSHRTADGNLYVAVYGRGLSVAVVEMRPRTARIVRTYDFSQLGDLGMVAIDNTRDRMVLKSGPRNGPHAFTTTDMSGRVLSRSTDASQGLGQGLELHGDDLLLLTSAPGHSSNTITVYSRDGEIRSKIHVPVAREAEGLSIDPRTGTVHVGFRDHTVRRMAPAHRPSAAAAPADRLVHGGAEGGRAGPATPTRCRCPAGAPAAA